jgi:hypothetical protein
MAGYFKGSDFMQECHRQGSRVILLTNEKLLDANWPRDSIDEIHAMPDLYNHEGGIFASCSLERGSPEEPILTSLNDKVITQFGLVQGVTHTEFIRGRDDGEFYFLETAARVGGAHIAELVEAASGINLWAEWAKLELAAKAEPYRLPELRQDYAGIIITLARQESPDTTAYDDPEIVWRLDKRHHAGLIVRSDSLQRVNTLIGSYIERFQTDFHASLPVPDRPID